MLIFGWTVALVLLFFVYVINKSMVDSVEKMSNPEGLVEPVAQIDDAGFLQKFSAFDQWASQHGFVHEKLFLGHIVLDGSALQCSVWWNEKSAIWALMYYHKGKHVYDFVTKLVDGGALTTASGKDAHTLPKAAKNYVQSRTDASFDTLFEIHQTTLQLLDRRSITVDFNKTDVIQELKSSLAQQMAYVKTLPLWRFRGVYWYFIRRNLLANKPIKI